MQPSIAVPTVWNRKSHYCPGSPKERLLPEAADWEADMIVIGNSARSLLSRKLFGETALHVIRNADRPLFLCQ